MSWATFKTEITTLLGAAYKEIPDNIEPTNEVSTTHVHKGYSLKWVGMGETVLLSDNGVSYSHNIELKIGFTIQPDKSRDTNALIFETFAKALAGKINFKNFNENPSFVDIDEKRQEGILLFLYGSESC